MRPFILSIFLSAFLLFQIQPMMGKVVLPWFGGTTAVWTTVMLFFQVLLTSGYAYANWLINRVSPSRQHHVHLSVIGASLLIVAALGMSWPSPITPSPEWRPQDVSTPILDIFSLLLLCVGLPYFVLAANGPLMQAWYGRAYPGRSYARLFSLSNIGSLAALLLYPVVVEPLLPLRTQGWVWAAAFLLFALIAAQITRRSARLPHLSVSMAMPGDEPAASHARLVLTLALSATPSLLLLAVTNKISQEIAVIPFLWIAPLTVYLLSFIVAFGGAYRHDHRLFAGIFVILTGLVFFLGVLPSALPIEWQIAANCLLLFAACMICHGELYRLRPPAAQLTSYYLQISLGGALGGVFVTLLAPVLFDGYWEFFVGLSLTMAIVIITWLEGTTSEHSVPSQSNRPGWILLGVFAITTMTPALFGPAFHGALFAERNFYGVVRVTEAQSDGSNGPAYLMAHGVTVHGLQFENADARDRPTTYYTPTSGAALALRYHPRNGKGLRVALLGLGIGTLAAYARPGDDYRLYEINPVVAELAHGQDDYFSFLNDSPARITTVIGDARLSLQREADTGAAQDMDVLVLDTFNSDSIPVHMLTREAFSLYLQRLAPGGVIAAHITNRHLDLQPVLWQLANYHGLELARLDDPGSGDGAYASEWILLARDRSLLDSPEIRARTTDLSGYSTDLRLWTDDFSNLFTLLR